MSDKKQIVVILLFMLLHFSVFSDNNLKAEKQDKENINEWTVICYLAGDNFLDWFMKENVKELIKAGSSNSVSVLALLDTTDNDTKVFEF